MSDPDIPEDHPLHGYEHLLDTHEGHLEAFGRVLQESDSDELHSVMLVITKEEGTDTIPSIHPRADAEDAAWYGLAAHIGHLASTFEASPVDIAKHAVHVLLDQDSGSEEIVADGGQIDQHPRDTSQRWIGQAEENVERWGNQPPLVLLLALVEEIGEAADEALATAQRPADLPHQPYHDESMVLLGQIRRDGFACREFLEDYFEDDHGDPLPAHEVPSLAYDLDRERVLDELEDAAPLVYQLRWALAREWSA